MLIFIVLFLVSTGYTVIEKHRKNTGQSVTEAWQNVMGQIDTGPFATRIQQLASNPSMDKEYRRGVLTLLKDFSDKMNSFTREGTLAIEQFMKSSPKNYNEGVQRSKDVQAHMQKIAGDISGTEFPEELVVKGKRYALKEEKESIEAIKDDYIQGFNFTAQGYAFAAKYFEDRNQRNLNLMKDAFRQADIYFARGISNLELMKLKYEGSLDAHQ